MNDEKLTVGSLFSGIGGVGSSGTFACIIPTTNGTYGAYFYGTDANLYQHNLAYKQIVVGTGTNDYGRDGWIAALLVVGAAAMLMTSSIAVSMMLACFGLFVVIAFGIIPVDVASTAAIMFTLVALALEYRLKI